VLEKEDFLFTETGNLEGNTAVLKGSKVTFNYNFDIAGQWFGGLYTVADPTLTTQYPILCVEVIGDANFEIKPNDVDMTSQFNSVGGNIYELSTSQIGQMNKITLVAKPKTGTLNNGIQTFILNVCG